MSLLFGVIAFFGQKLIGPIFAISPQRSRILVVRFPQLTHFGMPRSKYPITTNQQKNIAATTLVSRYRRLHENEARRLYQWQRSTNRFITTTDLHNISQQEQIKRQSQSTQNHTFSTIREIGASFYCKR